MAPGVLRSDSSMEDQNEDGRQNVDFDNTVDALTMLRSMPEPPLESQVCIVGAGPAGLMLAANLARFGVKVETVDDRADQTPVGR
jgi:phenol 2-monooxygenase (NADPH)